MLNLINRLPIYIFFISILVIFSSPPCSGAENIRNVLGKSIPLLTRNAWEGKSISVNPIPNSDSEFTDFSLWLTDQVEAALSNNKKLKLVSDRHISQILTVRALEYIDFGKTLSNLKTDYAICGAYYESAKKIEGRNTRGHMG